MKNVLKRILFFITIYTLVSLTDANASGNVSFTYSDNSKYFGGYFNGMKHGRGTRIYADGREYVGEFKNDNRHGKGFQTWPKTAPNNLSYEGTWKFDQPNGQGVYIYKNGDVYKGSVRNNRFHGLGTLLFANGIRTTGTFKNGKNHGKLIRTQPDGKKYLEYYEAGVRLSVTKLK